MTIIIVTGLIGSGKDSVARYISEKHGFHLLDHSVILGDILRKENRPVTREEKIRLRLERGNTFTAEEIISRINSGKLGKVVVGSSRRPEEFELTRKKFGGRVLLLYVHADPRTRFERVARRERDRPESWEHFKEMDAREESIYEFRKTLSYADYVIDNTSTMGDLHRRIDLLMGIINT